MRQLFEQVMIARLSKDLDFNEEETILLVRRFIEFREGLQEVRRERERAVRSLERAVKNSNTEEIEKLLPRVLDLEEQLANAKRRMYDHLSADLDPARKGKLYLWLKDFEGDMRRLLQQARRRADHQPGPPPPGPHDSRPQRGPLPHHPDGPPPPHHPQGGPPEHLPPPPPGAPHGE
jgi:hypothetical protein